MENDYIKIGLVNTPSNLNVTDIKNPTGEVGRALTAFLQTIESKAHWTPGTIELNVGGKNVTAAANTFLTAAR